MALTVDDIKEWLGSLEQKRDELRLQAHLLGMEARDEFDKVDQSIDKFRGAVQWVSSTASAAAREAPTTIKTGAEKLTRTVSDSITELRAAHADTLDTLKQRAGELHTEIEKATLSLQDAVGSCQLSRTAHNHFLGQSSFVNFTLATSAMRSRSPMMCCLSCLVRWGMGPG